MKSFVAGIGMCVACLSAASAQMMPKYGVTVTADKHIDFAKFKTYAWTPGQPSASKTIDARIVAAVDRELAALGFSRVTSRPAVLATYYSLSRTDVDLKSKPDAEGRLRQYSVGTLVVALLEPESRRRLLRLRVDQPIETDAAGLAASIDSAVTALFAEYPTRRRR